MHGNDIQTERLLLRPLAGADADWIAREIANPNVLRWLTAPPAPYGLSDAHDFLARFSGDPSYRAICSDQEPLGVISLGTSRGEAPELGYWLKESAWGRGIMMEAASAIVAAHWAVSSAPLISGWIVGNAASAQILTRLGFASTGRTERHVNFYGAARPLERVKLMAPHKPLFTERTKRLRLNAKTLEDLPTVHQEFGQPAIARMVSTITPNWSLEQARDWLVSRLVPTVDGFGHAIRLLDGTCIGSVGMGGPQCQLGYMLRPSACGQGYGTEAVAGFLRGALAHIDHIKRVEAEVFDDNPASIRVLEKLGFVRVGDAESHSLARSAAAPASRYAATRPVLEARVSNAP